MTSVDPHSRVALLTERQRDCLRLVRANATSKEIARELGISPHTADARLKAAIQTLGVASRREAARLLAEHEGTSDYQSLAYQAPQLAAGSGPLPPPAHPQTLRSAGDEHGRPGQGRSSDAWDAHGWHAAPSPALGDTTLHDAAMAAPGWSPNSGFDSFIVPQPRFRLWGGANDLTLMQRAVAVLLIMLFAMLAFGSMLAGIDALGDLRPR
ncbi:response regulator transcription factor [Sandaracinobacteroides saxicola]|uniref:Helix-turn-helix transcriptional regulator n=1 Tax=Sandaracinobacteroides saxicola TaxID=2759707 RepID=A0A7G5IJE1_9SPHN|nr:helix-turn-helix transcriptional regulator [Sandaracinobacteroides saxicola]QMW23483.1 helix-turn-helix transcriptional regulator [Sandaracinobacteroides saxicola]